MFGDGLSRRNLGSALLAAAALVLLAFACTAAERRAVLGPQEPTAENPTGRPAASGQLEAAAGALREQAPQFASALELIADVLGVGAAAFLLAERKKRARKVGELHAENRVLEDRLRQVETAVFPPPRSGLPST